jgi:hypothetical protein
MAHTAAHNAYLRRIPLQNEVSYFWHTGEAIRIVNERIRGGLKSAATEGTICAVCCMTQQQAFAASTTKAQVHLSGLLQLVRAAGGAESPTLSYRTRRLVMFADLAASITLDKRFHLRPIALLRGPNPSFYFPFSPMTHQLARELGTRFLNFTGATKLSEQVALVFWGLRSLSETLERIRQGKESPDAERAEDLMFTDRVEVLERALHPLWFRDSSTNSPNWSGIATPQTLSPAVSFAPAQHPLFRLFGLACLIYVYSFLRELPQLQMLGLVSTRIFDTLALISDSDTNELLATFPDLMLWVLFTAGKVAGPREKGGFARLVAKILIIRGVEEEAGVQSAASKFLWPDRGIVVVDGVERLRTMLEDASV